MTMKAKHSYEELEKRIQELKADNTQLEKKLLEASSFTEEVMTYMTEGFVLADTRGTVIFINQRLSEMLGYLPEEITGKCWLDMVSIEQQVAAQEEEARRAQGHIGRYEIVLRRKNGENFPVLICAGPRFDKQSGQYIGSMAVVNDITERKQAEDQLQKSEEQLRNLYDDAPVGYFEYDLRGNITRVNHTLLKSLGYTTKEMIGQPCWKFIVDEVAREQIMAKLDGVRPPAVGLERTYRRKDGTTFPVLFEDRLLLDEDGHIKGIRTAIQDITDRKQAEEALKESEKRFNLAMDASRDGVYEWDLETREIYYSPEWKRMLGYEPDELPDDFSIWEKLTRPEDVEKSWQIMKEVVAGKRERFEVEFQMQHKNGHWVHILSRSNIYKDSNGKLARVVGTHVDITEQKQAEAEREKSQALFKGLYDNMTSGSAVYKVINDGSKGSDYITVEFNKKSLEIEGKQREQVIGKTLLDLRPTIDDYGLIPVMRQVWETGSPAYYPIKMYQDDIFSSYYENYIFKIPSGEVVTIYNDVTHQKNQEKALKDKTEKLQAIFQAAQNISFIITDARDPEPAILEFSPGAENIFGYQKEEIIGKPVSIIHTPDDAARFPEAHQKMREGNVGFTGETTLIRKSGEPFTAMFSTYPLLDQNGNMYSALGVSIDITEMKRLETQLLQAQKLESVGRLAGGVAHDFNNMLGVIFGHTEMALEDADPAAPLYASLQAIHHAAERSAALTRQLLAFARKQTVAPKVIDINETVAGMLNMLRRLIGEDIDLLWHPGENLSPVKVDPAQIDQLLANLCVNARDAIAGVGKITIETVPVTFDEAYCAAHLGFVPGEYTLLALSDDGCGMDHETLGHIFEPFFTTKEQGKGTGLGLASVFGVVKQNKGFINVYSEPGQGTTFRIYLPKHTAKSAEMTGKAPDRPAEHGNETILLVEDEPAILKMTTMMLERLGYTVVGAATPGEAIRLAIDYQGRIDLLITDVVMPEMNGRDLAGNLLSHAPDLKRLFMSGYTANVIAHHGVLDPGVHFMQKPFSMQELAGKVREAISGT